MASKQLIVSKSLINPVWDINKVQEIEGKSAKIKLPLQQKL